MVADLYLSNAVVFDVEAFHIRLNESFTLKLHLEEGVTVDWFANNDPVLAITTSDQNAQGHFVANAPGKVTVQVQTGGEGTEHVQKTFQITVYDEAASLNPTIGIPELK